MTSTVDTTPPAGLMTGRTALVTGGVGAIGDAIARRFAREGARVIVADLDGEAASTAATQIAADTGAEVIGIGVDVTDVDALERAAITLERQVGVCDAIVANAGVLMLGPALELTPRAWNTVINVNLTGAFYTASVFARRLVAAHKPGTIVFSSSLFGVRGGPGNSAYSASKFGLLGLSQSMAAELAPLQVRVNAVCPGQVDTVMLDELFQRRAAISGRSAAEERDAFTSHIPLGRLGSVDEISGAFLYLSSSLSDYVTGQHLIVDGGWQVA